MIPGVGAPGNNQPSPAQGRIAEASVQNPSAVAAQTPAASDGQVVTVSPETIARAINQMLASDGAAIFRTALLGLEPQRPDVLALLKDPSLSLQQRAALMSEILTRDAASSGSTMDGGAAATIAMIGYLDSLPPNEAAAIPAMRAQLSAWVNAQEALAGRVPTDLSPPQSPAALLLENLARVDYAPSTGEVRRLLADFKRDVSSLAMAAHDPSGAAAKADMARRQFFAVMTLVGEARAGNTTASRLLRRLAVEPASLQEFLAYASQLNAPARAETLKSYRGYGTYFAVAVLLLAYLFFKYVF